MNVSPNPNATKKRVVWEPDLFSFKSTISSSVVDVPNIQLPKKTRLANDLEDLERERLAALISTATSDECGILTISDAFIDTTGTVFVESASNAHDTHLSEKMTDVNLSPLLFENDFSSDVRPIAGPLPRSRSRRNAGVLSDIGGFSGWKSVFVDKTHRAPPEWAT
tara:strand:- start:5378 stop:5875 length:498 start_codon:yes stop_codon:yes gene_type:complete